MSSGVDLHSCRKDPKRVNASQLIQPRKIWRRKLGLLFALLLSFLLSVSAAVVWLPTLADAEVTASPTQAIETTPTAAASPTQTDTSAGAETDPATPTPTQTDAASSTETAAATEAPATAEPQATAPTIVSDQSDYPPGSTVHLSGSGWAAGETVEIVVNDTYGGTWEYLETVTATADGTFDVVFTLPDWFVSDYDVTATGSISGTATTSFTDAAGSYTLKWYAADPDVNRAPYLPTYHKVLPGALAPYPVDRANDPLKDAVAYGPTATSLDAVTSVSPKSMALGQVVPFELEIKVSGSTTPENGVITISPDWLAKTTSGGDFGFDPVSYGLIAAFVDYGDVGSVDPLGNATVSRFSWSRAGAGTNNDRVVGNITVTGLDNGDTIIVELWVVLKSSIPSGVSGNVQTSLVSANTGPTLGGGSTINTGNQTVPLLRANDFFSAQADLSLTKSDNPDPVLAGRNLTYTLVITNKSTTTVANSVMVTDTLDANTVFVSGSWPGGTCTAAANVVTCNLGALEPLQTVTVTVVVTVPTTAPAMNDPSGNPETGTCTAAGPGIDLCNRVSVTQIGVDPNTLNNSDSEPTNVAYGAVTLTKYADTGALLAGAQFRLYTGTPASPFNPANPGTEFGSKLLYTTGSNGQILVDILPLGSYFFVEVAAPSGYLLNRTPISFSITEIKEIRVEQVSKIDWKAPAITKSVSAPGTTAASGDINENLTFILQPLLPGNIENYTSYVITDALPAALTYTDQLTMTVAGATLIAGTHYTVTAPTGPGGTLTITLIPSQFGSFDNIDLIQHTQITFTAKINNAAIMGKAIPNTATVSYNDGLGDPDSSGTTTSNTVNVYTGGKNFIKTDVDDNPLVGAKFKVAHDAAGTNVVKNPTTGEDLILTSDADGLFSITGLKYDLVNGTSYYLVETKAPYNTATQQYYNLLTTSIRFTVTGTSYYTNPTLITSPATPANATPDQIINRMGFQIPQTGGIGTLLFTILGLGTMGGALLLNKKSKATRS